MPTFLFLTAICFLVAAESTPGLTPENQWDVGMNYAHQTIHFLVGEGDEKELLPAHKAILEKASGVFEGMFRFDEANAKAAAAAGTGPSEEIKPVEVPDMEVGAFKAMLAFIYADDLSELNGDNAISVLYAAHKYNLPKLVKACLNFPIPELRNVFDALDLEEPSAENRREMLGLAPFIKFKIKTQNVRTIFNMPRFDRKFQFRLNRSSFDLNHFKRVTLFS